MSPQDTEPTLPFVSHTCSCRASPSRGPMLSPKLLCAEVLMASPITSSWLKDALLTASSRDPIDAVRDAEMLVSVPSARCSLHLSAACPACEAQIGYDAWVPVDSEPSLMSCPACLRAVSVDDVYTPSSAGPRNVQTSPTLVHEPHQALQILYVISRLDGSHWRYLGHHTALQHRDYLARCAEVLLPGEALSYSLS